MKTFKRTIIGLILSLTMLFNTVVVAFATEDIQYITDERVIYSILRDAFVDREPTVTIYYSQKGDLEDGYFQRWIEGALAETGEADEGDYLRKHLGHSSGSGSGWYDSTGMYYYTFNFQFEYYTTKEQEDVVEDRIEEVFDELSIDTMKSDYEKIVAIYDYICDNVVYDYTNLEDDTYDLKYTAYAALINKTSVCQGYANLLYRMLHEAGIDSRIITGIGNGGGHAWNIVEINDKYYYADATWDAVRTEYEYFLKGTTDFVDHKNDDEFLTETFLAKYPIPETGYINCIDHTFGEYVSDNNATCTEDGTKTAICEKCGMEDTVIDEGSKTGHKYGEWVVEKEATTEEEGRQCQYCYVCGELLAEEAIPKLILLGDTSGDGVVDTKDVTIMRRYIVGGYGVSIDIEAADVNNDGTVDTKDVTLLRRYIVGGYGVVLQ